MTRGLGRFLLAGTAVGCLASLLACGGGNNGATPPTPPAPNSSGPVEIFPGTVSAPLSGQVHFTAFLPGTPAANFTWSVSGGSTNGAIDASTGVYTAPTSIPNPATATITATATGTGTTGTATINITAVQGVVVAPSGVAVPANASQLFSATIDGLPVSPTWEVNGTPGGDGQHGTITSNGLYTAPLTPPPGGSTTVTAVSGGNAGTSSVTVTFSSSSLNGPYAFSYGGSDSGGPLAVAGSFTASASAGTIKGVEDYNSLKLKAPAQAQAINGTFVVYPDGSGSATVTEPSSGSDTWHFALTPGTQGSTSQHVLLVRFDSMATGSGAMDQQNPTQITLSAITGNYAFGLGGLNASGQALHITGKFRADGLGDIPVNFAAEDINDGNGQNTGSAADTTLFGSFSLDSNFPGSGRGTLQLINTYNTVSPATSTPFPGTFNFTFYMVDATHLKIVENDVSTTTAFLAGDCFSAPNSDGSFGNAILKGNFAFTLGGGTSGAQPLVVGGVFGADGAGNISAGAELDRNANGTTALAQKPTATTYTVDANLGRIKWSWSIGGTSYSFAAYSTSNGLLEIIELDTASLVNGEALPQSSTGLNAGTFAINIFGVTGGSKSFVGQNLLGEVQANPSLDSLSGTIDINSAGTLVSGVPLETTTNASAISSADGAGRGTANLVTRSGTFDVVYYVVGTNSVLLLGTDSSQVSLGSASGQF
jgi:hypothetical protein